ncbi:hypothetical protein NWF32_25450 [Pseudomonas qingdaonensis]|nr:hypothetical protein [Pseudomonas qingdaonensis]
MIDSASENQDMATTRARKLLADSRLEGFGYAPSSRPPGRQRPSLEPRPARRRAQ